MGIFDFFKKKEDEVIKFTEVESWIDRQLSEKNLDKKIGEFRGAINQKITESKELLEALEKATLMNENIPERVKHIMEGNRKNYIQKTTFFLDEINIPDNYLEIREFSKELTDKLDNLSKETQKSYFVLKEFIESDLAKVARKVKEIEDTAIKFRQDIEKENLHKLEQIKEKLSDYENSKHVLAELNHQKEKQEQDLQELKSKAKIIENKITNLRTDKSYKEYEELKDSKERILADIQNQKKLIIAHFSTLDKAFKKYARISLNEKLIEGYLNNPAKALIEDEKLDILEILGKMRNSLSNLGLKDKKLEKTKEEIEKLTKEILTKMKEDIKFLEEKQKENKRRILANTSSMNISEQESWLENMQHKVKEQERVIEETDHKIERVNPKLIKQHVRDLLKEFSVIMGK